MKAYKICPKGKRSGPVWIGDTTQTLPKAFEEFKRTYGIGNLTANEPFRYYTMLANVRLSLYRDKRRLNLNCNPLVDDLSYVFVEWISTKPGFKRMDPSELKDADVEDFLFPY